MAAFAMLKLFLVLQIAFFSLSLAAQTSVKSVHLYVNHKVGSNTTGHLISVIVNNIEHHAEVDSLILHFGDLNGLAKSYIDYLGIRLPKASRIIEDSAQFVKKINYQYHTIELLEGDSTVLSSPLKLFDPSLLNRMWPAKPGVRWLNAMVVGDIPYFHRLDYIYPDPTGFWLKSDNNLLYKFDFEGKLLFRFSPDTELPWQEIYAKVLKNKGEKLNTAQYYFNWFKQNGRYAFPMYDAHVSTDGHIYIHSAAQPFEISKSKTGKTSLSAEPYIFLLKINTRTFEWKVLYTANRFNISKSTYFDFDNLYVNNDVGFVSTEVVKRGKDQVGLSKFSIVGDMVIKPKEVSFPDHGNADFVVNSFIKTSIIETKENVFVARSRDSVIMDLNNPSIKFTLNSIKNGRTFNLQRAGQVSSNHWYLYHSDDDQNYVLTILKDTTVVHNFKMPFNEELLLGKAFVHEKILYVPLQTADGKLELRRFALRFRSE